LSIYFYFLDTNIFDSGFMRNDFALVVCFILLINFYYITVSLFAEKEMNEIINNESTNQNTDEADYLSMLTIHNGAITASFEVDKEIMYFYRENRKMFIVTIDGNVFSHNMTIDELKDQYN